MTGVPVYFRETKWRERGEGLPVITRMKEAPVPGQYYRVPAVRMDRFGLCRDRSVLVQSLWWPVIGKRHEDREFFNFALEHYHVDVRFLGRRHFAQTGRRGRFVDRERDAISQAQAQALLARIDVPPARRHLPEPVLVRMKCYRANERWNFPDAEAVMQMCSAFAGHQARHSDAGWVCPHRQYPLGQVEPDESGVITCPLHGLRIDARTGRCLPGLSSRVKEDAS